MPAGTTFELCLPLLFLTLIVFAVPVQTANWISLAFGYAIHPAEGDGREALLRSAGAPRLRMV